MANDWVKREQKENIDDLVRVFGPIDERINKKFVTLVYDSCLGVCIKQKPYIREAMSLAKILAAKQLEDFITGEAKAASDAAKAEAEETVALNGGMSIADEKPSNVRTKTKFI